MASRPEARRAPWGGTAVLAFLLVLCGVGSARAQVIRSYEHLDRTAGQDYYATAAFLFDGATGNTDFVDTDVSGGLGYRGTRHWVRIYPAYRVKRSQGETVIRNRSAHLRHSLFLSDRMRTFAFVQIQSEEAIDLERRSLVGGGLRYQLLSFGSGGVDLGVGMMLDDERRTGQARRSDVRGANFLTIYGDAGAIRLSGTAYFQPALDDWVDHRVLAFGVATIPLVASLSLDVSASWRRDTRPPSGIERNDAGLKVGFRFDVD